MKYAYSQNERILATPKAQGICICCGSEMIAKCGNQKIWHWAHKNRRQCDTWWENETEWHRNWKDKFPKEWQEVVHFSDDGEKHIADVKTRNGFVIEFQHSAISPSEMASREQFYTNMIWIVDGTRLLKDLERFTSFEHWQSYQSDRYDHANRRALPKRWINSSVPVFFDFGIDDWLYGLIHQYDPEAGNGPVSVTMKIDYLVHAITNSGAWQAQRVKLK